MENTCVIIATYNERENLQKLLETVFGLYPKIAVMIVDDNSPDGTGVFAEGAKGRYPGRLSVVHRPRKAGYASASIHGIIEVLKNPRFLRIVTMDADLSHDPADIGRLVEASDRVDFVLGSRFVEGSLTEGRPPVRNLISHMAAWFSGWLLGFKVRDISTGFRCYNRRVLEAMDFEKFFGRDYSFLIELAGRALRQGFRCEEIPITFRERRNGESKFETRMLWDALCTVARLRFS